MKLKAKINGVASTIDVDLHQIIRYATVTEVDGNKVNLKFDGEQEASSLSYKATCTCVVGYRVVCVNDGFNTVILGAIK